LLILGAAGKYGWEAQQGAAAEARPREFGKGAERMMKAKLFVVALAATTLSSGCMCFQGNCSRGGGEGASYSYSSGGGGGGGSIAEGDLMRIEEAANRAEAAANRAEAAADRASLAAEKAESLFHRGLRK